MEINNLSIIGSGNMAWAYAEAFYSAGLNVESIISRNLSAAEDIANQFRAEAYTDYAWLEKSDVILICVSDMAIREVSESIQPYVSNKLIAHSSGALSKSLLDNHPLHGILWPLQTITKGKRVNWKETPIFFDANDPEVATGLRYLASSISDKVEMRNDAERQLLHLAAVWANNFSNHMYNEAKEVLEVAGIDFSVLVPIIKETVQKLETHQPSEAQTGPASRRDQKTIQSHIDILSRLNSSKSEVYKLISERIVDLS